MLQISAVMKGVLRIILFTASLSLSHVFIPVDLTSTGEMPKENRECLRAFTCHLQDWMSPRYTDIHWEEKHTQGNTKEKFP